MIGVVTFAVIVIVGGAGLFYIVVSSGESKMSVLAADALLKSCAELKLENELLQERIDVLEENEKRIEGLQRKVRYFEMCLGKALVDDAEKRKDG